MSKENGFLQLRRGLWEHIRDGRMSITVGLAFVYICSQADTRTGIWKGCAKSLAGELAMKDRTARDALEKMERGDYIRRFAVPGLHSCYPILVHKFPITQGEHNGEQLNALESKSPVDLAYFSREQDGEQSVEHGAAQRRRKNGELRKNTSPKPEGFDSFWKAYPKREAKADAEKAWRKVKPEQVSAILARLEILKSGKWRGMDKQYIPNPATWLNGRRWEDEIEQGAPGQPSKPATREIGTAPIKPLPDKPFQERDWSLEELCPKNA